MKRLVVGFLSALAIATFFPAASTAAPEGSYTVVDHGTDSCGMEKVMRRGYFLETEPDGSGFGRDKIEYKHQILNRNLWRWVLGAPGCGTSVGETKYRYDGYVDNFSCDRVSATCRTIDSMPIRLEIDQRQLNVSPETPNNEIMFGVVTMYCNKTDSYGNLLVHCPPWVSRAIPSS